MNHHTSLLILVSLCAIFFQSLMQVKSFSFELIHRDSPLSLLYNKSISQSEFLVKDAHRSHAQVNIVRNSSSTYSKELMLSTIESSGSNYLTKYYLGSNKFEVDAFVSLTTYFTWTKCSWINQEGEEKVYKWDESRSYERVIYSEPACTLLPFTERYSFTSYCGYKCLVNQGVYTNGVIAMDKTYFYSSKPEIVEYGKMLFGCSYTQTGFDSDVQGVLGLGRGLLSMVSMLKEETKNKFSYCLPEPTSKQAVGILKFGDIRESIESKMTSVPFENSGWKELSRTIGYQVPLEGVSIGDNDIEKAEPHQLIKIQLGTSMTYLPENIYQNIKDKLENMFDIHAIPLAGFKICFDNKEDNRIRLPKMALHFSGAAIYMLNPSNIFVEDEQNEIFCLAIFESPDAISVFGSKAQENHVMQFDIENNRLSFTLPGDDCNSF